MRVTGSGPSDVPPDESSGETKLSTIRISARHSDLARLQALRVGDALRQAHPKTKVVYGFRASLGDQNLSDPLWKMPEKGVFTEDFLRDLTEGSAELVVHSWKDLPTEVRPQTEIAATLPRADVRDLLLFRKDRFETARASGRVSVLTSSPRRAHNLGPFLRIHLPFQVRDVVFENVRGNIPTRLKKLLSQDVDALIVAKAALDRLLASTEAEFEDVRLVIRQVLSQTNFMVLPLTVNPTAAAQGALAVEILRTRADVRDALKSIHHPETFSCVEREREILASYGGGCHQKIGVTCLDRHYGRITYLRGLTDRGEVLDGVRLEATAAPQPPATSSEAIFPADGEEATFFSREVLPRQEWAWAEREALLWVARENAWPADFRAPGAVVWTSGLRTWQKLAERGVWVNGSTESLGEEEPTQIEELLGEATLKWTKMTHAEAPLVGAGKVCATYRLTPKDQAPSLKNKTHFFWMSGSSFDRARELNPAITQAHHACGPGHTYRHLRAALGEDASIAIHLSVDDWRRSILATPS